MPISDAIQKLVHAASRPKEMNFSGEIETSIADDITEASDELAKAIKDEIAKQVSEASGHKSPVK